MKPDRLKMPVLEQLRDHHDRSQLGLILIGMPAIPSSTAGSGLSITTRPLSTGEQAFVLARHWPHLGMDDRDDLTTAEALAAITRITGGNLRLISRLAAQIERILKINQMTTITKEVVDTARESLVSGHPVTSTGGRPPGTAKNQRHEALKITRLSAVLAIRGRTDHPVMRPVHRWRRPSGRAPR